MAGLTGLGMVGVLVSLILRLEEAPAANGPAVSGCIATGRAGMVSRGLGWLASRYGEEQSVWAAAQNGTRLVRRGGCRSRKGGRAVKS